MSKMTGEPFEEFLKTALDRREPSVQADEAAAERVLARLTAALPPQKTPFRHWPAVLLDWQFSPAWPRLAALAFCAAIGFGIGLAGLDRPFDRLGTPFVVADRGLGSVVFGPEPLTGARP